MKLNNLDLNKVAVFCQIIDSGNYSRASEILNVTPSALSQTVSALEYALGFPLFDRVGRKMVPTDKALTLHREFRAHHAGFLRSLRELTAEDVEVSGLLRVGAYLEFAKAQLSTPIRGFVESYPEAQIKMVFDTPTRLQRLLQKDQLDLCFSIFPAHDKSLASEDFYQEELVLISSSKFLSDAPTYEQVLAAPMIEYYFNHQPIRRWLSLHYNKRPRKIPVRVYASTAEMVVALVREGAGIGVVPLFVLNGLGERGVRVIRPTSRRLTDHIWMLERANAKRSPLHRAFKARLRMDLGLES